MPVIFYKKNRIIIHWTKKQDNIILLLGRKYKRKKEINWKKSVGDPLFQKLGAPSTVNARVLSKRHTYLKACKNPDFLRRRRRNILFYNALNKNKSSQKSKKAKKIRDLREKIFQNIPQEFKKEYPCKNLWSNKAWKTLCFLASKYKKGSFTNWAKVVKDKRSRIFPIQYIPKLKIYHKARLRRNQPDVLKQRRMGALKYKYQHLDQYHANQRKRYRLRKKLVDKFLSQNT